MAVSRHSDTLRGRRERMLEHRTHTWEYVLGSLRKLAAANAYFEPMRDAMAQLAASPYAAGLYPVLSMHTVRLYQNEHYSAFDEELRLDFEDAEFVLRHRSGSTPVPQFAKSKVAGVWVKRGPQAMPLLERAFHHLRWFNEYSVRPDDEAAH